jgi:hypothetical protein
MALAIDLSRAAASPTAREALVDAILKAPAHEPETDYLEWKSALDLSEKHRRAEVATDILAFANRDVAVAARHMDGTAYLVIGVEPGNLAGVQPVDPARLVDWVAPHVGGQAGPQWDPHYVDVGGVQVLVITVVAPRDGDRAWPVRKGFNGPGAGRRPLVIPEGAIYVRRGGLTVQADAAEHDMLTARARGSARRTNVRVQPPGGRPLVVQAVDLSHKAIERYVGNQMELLMRSLAEAQRAERAKTVESVMGRPVAYGPAATAGIVGSVNAFLSGAVKEVTEPEKRSASEYTDEVKAYLEKLRSDLREYVAWRALRKRLAVLRLEVRNLTEDNFLQLQVNVHVSGSAWGTWELPFAPDLPTPPQPYGPRVVTLDSLAARMGTFDLGYLGPKLAARMPSVDVRPRGRISNSGSVDVEHEPFDLRPGETEDLDELLLFIRAADAGKSLDVTWRATSTSASGTSTGAFTIEVLPQLAGPEQLLPDNLDAVDDEEVGSDEADDD